MHIGSVSVIWLVFIWFVSDCDKSVGCRVRVLRKGLNTMLIKRASGPMAILLLY